MPDRIDLTASDGHTFGAWKAAPSGAPKGALLVIQEAFGVNAHIREMVDKYAAEGYLALAPQLYDRVERDVDVGYVGEDRERGIACMKAMDFDDAAVKPALPAGAGVALSRGWRLAASAGSPLPYRAMAGAFRTSRTRARNARLCFNGEKPTPLCRWIKWKR
jgi:carboxymethylenebutenolidase